MIEIAPGLYIPASRIVAARIYEKEGKFSVRFAMDTVNVEERAQFSGKLDNREQALAIVQNAGNAM